MLELSHFLFQSWFFSTSMEPVKTWKIKERQSLADHLLTCPYNIRNSHDKWCEKSEIWDSLLNELSLKLKQKQIPSMWSESLLKN